MMPKVLESAISLSRSGFPDTVPGAVELTTKELKGWPIPALAQLATLAAGLSPALIKRTSQGSWACD